MKAKITYTSDNYQDRSIELTTLDDLILLINNENCHVIIDNNKTASWKSDGIHELFIEVYDSYRE